MTKSGHITQKGDYLYEIPATYRSDMRVSARFYRARDYAENISPVKIRQLLRGAYSASARPEFLVCFS